LDFDKSCSSLIIIKLGYGLDDQGSVPGGGNDGIFISLAPLPDQLWVHPASSPVGTRALTAGVKQLGHEVHHSLPSSAEVKNVWSYTSTPTIHLNGMVVN
jgi:hypothetical protein